MNKRVILPGLTTTKGSDWKEKIAEIDQLSIKEIALFPTLLEIKQRKELYFLLEKTKLQRIPHVHLRDDMQTWELDFLTQRYGAEVFNFHANLPAGANLKHTQYVSEMYVENQEFINEDFYYYLERCAGICLDVSHIEDFMVKQKEKTYENFETLLKKHAIGCAHISAIQDVAIEYEHYLTKEKLKYFSAHYLENLSQLDYVEKYVRFLPKYVSIELENSFKQQLEVKAYLEKIINA